MKGRLPTPADFQAGTLKPVYLLYGEESYLVEQALKAFWERTVDPALCDFNRDSFHAEDVEPASFFALASSFPMMAERRLVVLKGLEKGSVKLKEDMLAYLNAPSETSCVVLTADKVDKRLKFWKTLIGGTIAAIEFRSLKQDELSGWLMRECRAQQRELDPAAAEELALQLGQANLHMATRELEKIFLCCAEGSTIRPADLNDALGMERNEGAFALGDALLARNLKGALRMLPGILRRPDAEYLVVPGLIRSFGWLWYIRCLTEAGASQARVVKELGIAPFVVQKTMRLARDWTRVQTEQACELLNIADAGLKGGSALQAPQLLSQLVIELCRIQ